MNFKEISNYRIPCFKEFTLRCLVSESKFTYFELYGCLFKRHNIETGISEKNNVLKKVSAFPKKILKAGDYMDVTS